MAGIAELVNSDMIAGGNTYNMIEVYKEDNETHDDLWKRINLAIKEKGVRIVNFETMYRYHKGCDITAIVSSLQNCGKDINPNNKELFYIKGFRIFYKG